MSSQPPALQRLQVELLSGPSLLPQKIDLAAQRTLLVRLEREAFKSASFLDDRVLTPSAQGMWVAWSHLYRVLESAPPPGPMHFVFHIGHVGSTLLSRLLDEAHGVLGLREPLLLRTLAEAFDSAGATHAVIGAADLDALVRAHLRLLSRGFADTRCVVVKATSAVGRIAGPLIERSPGAAAVYLSLKAEPYLATLLAGENSAIDLRGMGPERVKRLEARGVSVETPLYAMSPGELAALAWTAETNSMLEAVSAHSSRVLELDFELLLERPVTTLARVFSHFGLAVPAEETQRIAGGPALHTYSKDPSRPYSAQYREQVLANARRTHAEEIVRGLRAIERFAAGLPALAERLRTSGA